MIRRVIPALLLLASTACTTVVGTPIAAPITSVTTTSPRIDTPRDLAHVDTCKLLTPEDFKDAGPFAVPPAPHEKIPGSCMYQIGEDKPDDLLVLVDLPHRDYEQAKAESPKGSELLYEGHSVWTSCRREARELVCLASAAVADDRTLRIAMRLLGGNSDQLVMILHSRLRAALKRLPVTS